MLCIGMSYEKAASVATPSCSRKDPKTLSRLEKEYGKVHSPGNGWVYVYQTSKFLLMLANGKKIDVAPFFKEKLGKLTLGQREAIEETMPSDVKLAKGCIEVVVLDEWLLRAMKVNTPKARKERAIMKSLKEAEDERVWLERVRKLKAEHEQKVANAQRLAFTKGFNNKLKREQWSCRTASGVLNVLRFEDEYCTEEGAVPVELIRELVPGKIHLVRRIAQD